MKFLVAMSLLVAGCTNAVKSAPTPAPVICPAPTDLSALAHDLKVATLENPACQSSVNPSGIDCGAVWAQEWTVLSKWGAK